MLTSRFIFAFSQWLCIKPFTTQTINRQIQRRRHFIQRFFTKFQWKCRLRLFQSFALYVEKDQTFVHVNRKIHETTTLSGIATKKNCELFTMSVYRLIVKSKQLENLPKFLTIFRISGVFQLFLVIMSLLFPFVI